MKKIISLLISIQLLILPAFADYDFSDEAQAEFDRQQAVKTLPVNSTTDFSRKKRKTDVKPPVFEEQNNDQLLWEPSKDETPQQSNQNTQDGKFIPFYQTPDSKIEQAQQYYQQQYNNQNDLFQQAGITNNQNNMLYGSVVKVPAGTTFDVTFDSGISSGSLDKNDRLTVRLVNDLKYNGQVIAPAGSLVYGTATDAQNAGYAYGSGALELNFNQILTPDGNMIPVSTRKIILKAKSERAVKMTRDVVVGALGSMAIGALFTALGGGGDWGKSMLIYGGIGALGGGVRGAMQRGEDINIPDGTTITVTLDDTLTANPYSLQY